MFILFSPYSFIFCTVYIAFILSLSVISNFYYFWSVIELIMLIFIGLSYTLFVSSYSQLITYFLIQTLSSFLILVAYVHSIDLLMTLSIFIKLSMFPFFMWFVNVVYRFPNFMFFLVSTFHKLPVILMISYFSIPVNSHMMWISIISTTAITGFMMLSVVDFRMILVLSSVGNNSWFILSQMSGLSVLLSFVVVYSFTFYLLLSNLNSLSKPQTYTSLDSTSYSLSFWVLSLSGMPPFPIFYINILIVYSLTLSIGLNSLLPLFLVMNSFMFIAYVQSILKYHVHTYSTSVCYILHY